MTVVLFSDNYRLIIIVISSLCLCVCACVHVLARQFMCKKGKGGCEHIGKQLLYFMSLSTPNMFLLVVVTMFQQTG